jgi:hypothetical protein
MKVRGGAAQGGSRETIRFQDDTTLLVQRQLSGSCAL